MENERDPVDVTDLASPRLEENRPAPAASKAAEVFGVDWRPLADRTDAGRRLAETLAAVMRERSQIEMEYAERLRAAASKLEVLPVTEGQTVKRAVAGVVTALKSRARGAEEFAENVSTDIVKGTLVPTIRNHSKVFGQISFDGAACSKDVSFSQEDYDAKGRNYAEACAEAEMLAEKCQSAGAATGAARSKLVTRSLAAIGRVEKSEPLLIKSATNLNTVREAFNRQSALMLRSLEEMDKKRVQCVADSLRKLTVFELGMVSNNKYEQDQLIGVVNAVDGDVDMAEFYLRTPEPAPALSCIEPRLYPDIDREVLPAPVASASNPLAQWSNAVLKDVVTGLDSLISTGLQNPKRKTTPDETEEEISYVPSADATATLMTTWLAVLGGLQAGDMTVLETYAGRKLKDDLSSSLHRHVLGSCLQRLHDENRVVFPSMVALRSAGALLVWALEYCERQNDFWNARTFMMLAPWFSSLGTATQDPQQSKFTWPKSAKAVEKIQALLDEPAAGEQQYSWTLHRCIYHHRIWNRVQFWEDALMYTIAEARQGEFLARKHPDSAFLDDFNKSNPLRCSLPLLAPLMVSYGIMHEQVSHLILKICVAFDLGEEAATEMLASLKDDTMLPALPPVIRESSSGVEYHSLSNTNNSEPSA